MTAWQRSNIVQRSEKGIGAISFKRLLLAGAAGGIVAMLGGRVIGFLPSCLGAGIVLALVLAISHPVEGLALYAFSLRTLRGLATLAVLHQRGGPLARLGGLLKVSASEGTLQASQAYGAAWQDDSDGSQDTLGGEWEYLGGFGDAGGEGLSAIDNPFAGRGGEG